MPIIRMQPDVQNQGYGAGVAAAMAAKTGRSIRELDIKALQRHLIEVGNLPESVLTDKDSFPLPRERFVQAAEKVVHDYDQLEVLLTEPDRALPIIRENLAKTTSASNQLVYAHILCMLGDRAGADILRPAVKAAAWDEGWHFKGGGQYGMSVSRLDSYIIALARCGDPASLAVIIEKAGLLQPNSEFSHFRAIALALELYRDPAAAPVLARLLRLEGVGGHALTSIETAINRQQTRSNEDLARGRELAELSLARALYRCGDFEGLGEKTLKEFAQNLQGHHARHAQAVLRETKRNLGG
jgi:hypothetical protein